VDFTRAFRVQRQLQEPGLLQRVDRRLYDGLRALDREALKIETDRHLSGPERNAVMARRDLILAVLTERIATRGEAAVICDLPGH
jgi:hypothetical protein